MGQVLEDFRASLLVGGYVAPESTRLWVKEVFKEGECSVLLSSLAFHLVSSWGKVPESHCRPAEPIPSAHHYTMTLRIFKGGLVSVLEARS